MLVPVQFELSTQIELFLKGTSFRNYKTFFPTCLYGARNKHLSPLTFEQRWRIWQTHNNDLVHQVFLYLGEKIWIRCLEKQLILTSTKNFWKRHKWCYCKKEQKRFRPFIFQCYWFLTKANFFSFLEGQNYIFLHAVKCCGNLHLISFSILTLNPHSLNTFTPWRRSFTLFKTFRGQKISWRKKKFHFWANLVVTISFP